MWSSLQSEFRHVAANEQIYIDFLRQHWTEPRSKGLSVLRGETPASAKWFLHEAQSRLEERTSTLLNYCSFAAFLVGFFLISSVKGDLSALNGGILAASMVCFAARLLYPDLRPWFRAVIAPVSFFTALACWFFAGAMAKVALVPSIQLWPLKVRDVTDGLPESLGKLPVLTAIWILLTLAVTCWLLPMVSRWLTKAAGP